MLTREEAEEAGYEWHGIGKPAPQLGETALGRAG